MRTLLSILFLNIFVICNCQVGINTNNPKATLDIRAIDPNNPTGATGLTIPKVKNLPLEGNRVGQLIFHEAPVNDLFFFTGTNWQALYRELPREIGDIKHGLQNADHDGWFIMDGRSFVTAGLTSTQTDQAILLGLVSNLPDARDRYLKSKSTGKPGDVGGSGTVALLKENIPNYSISGTTPTHTHSHANIPAGNLLTTNQGAHQNATGGSGRPGINGRAGSTTAGGDHTHQIEFSADGSGELLDIELDYVQTNVFIYLGF